MDTKDLQKQVGDIYAIVSSLNVSGDAVDVMAVVRSKLRKLNADIAELKIVVKEPPNIPTTAVAEPCAKEAANAGDRTTGTLSAVKISDLPPTPDIYDSKMVPAGPEGPKGEPGEPDVKEAVNNGGQDDRGA